MQTTTTIKAEMKNSNRTVQKKVWLNPEEDKDFTEMVEELGSDFSGFVRQLLYARYKQFKKEQAA